MRDDISLTIIAGGKGSRFGRPKYNALFKGKRLIDRAVTIAKKISSKISVSCGILDCNLPAIVTPLRDIVPECGPLGGIYTALHYSTEQWIAVMPVDMPFLSEKIYEFLLQNRGDEDIPLAAVSGKGLEPLVSIWPKSAEKIVEEQVLEGKYSIRRCLKILRAEEIKIPQRFCGKGEDPFYNINTQQDLIV